MFIENKYKKWYFDIVDKAKSQVRKKKQGIYYESHHIIPRCMGGIEEILLTAKEHFLCHLLLPKFTFGEDKYKMINALIRMTFSKSSRQERYTSRSFALVRAFISERNAHSFKGKVKSQEFKDYMKVKMLGKNKGKHPMREFKKGQIPWNVGISPSKESIEKRTSHRLGKKWANNGDVEMFVSVLPEGFSFGRLK